LCVVRLRWPLGFAFEVAWKANALALQGEGHLAVGNSAAWINFLIVSFSGRCVAVRKDERRG